MKIRLRGERAPGRGRLPSLGQDFDRGHREYVANLTPGNALWLRTKPFSAPPNFELMACLRTFAHIVERLELGLRAQVLDVGCGPGWLSEFLARCGYWVTGIDISEDMVEIARERVASIDGPVGEGIEPHAEFHAMRVHDLPWENRFDAAVLYDTLHHFDDEVATLEVLYRSLVPGGRIYVREGVMPAPGSESEQALIKEMEEYGTLESPFEPRYLGSVLERAGFVDVRRFVEVDELLAVDDARRPLRLLARWAKVRVGRALPETNTLLATKPISPDGGDGFAARVELAAPPVRADGELLLLLRAENTGGAFWPAPISFPYPQGVVTIGLYVLDGVDRRDLGRVSLPRSVGPGDSVEVTAPVPEELLRGADAVLIDVVREGIAWFSAPDSPLLRVPL
ncbi:MAG: class I SAM-dependent methyltransferase [Gaiellaceae bacterium]